MAAFTLVIMPWLLMTMMPFGNPSTIDRTFFSCSVSRMTAWFTMEAIATSSRARAMNISKDAALKLCGMRGDAVERNTYQPRTLEQAILTTPVQKPPSRAAIMITG